MDERYPDLYQLHNELISFSKTTPDEDTNFKVCIKLTVDTRIVDKNALCDFSSLLMCLQHACMDMMPLRLRVMRLILNIIFSGVIVILAY